MAKKINRKKLEELIKDIADKYANDIKKTPIGTLVTLDYHDLIDELTTQIGIFIDKSMGK